MRLITPILCLVLLVAAGFLVWRSKTEDPRDPGPDNSEADRSADNREPDLRLGDATIVEFNNQGMVRYRLHAKAMARFESDDQTLLGTPKLQILSDDGGPPWDVVAEDGAIQQITSTTGLAESVVLLRRNVVLKQIDTTTALPMLTIRSEAIDLFPDRKFAKSETSVMIDSDVGRTRASGMEGDLQSGRLFLSSGPERPVHTIVLPTQFKARSSS
jgi:LPS export ABC transporter protein LptC